MHPAAAFREEDGSPIRARVAERGFAVIVAVKDRRPLAAHAPVLLDGLCLRFHLSAANPVTGALVASERALAVITGDDAYVSPDWYAAPDQVPTWNYVSVEIEGVVRPLGRAETVALLDDLAARYEAALAPKPPWTRAKMDPRRFEALLAGIVAFEMAVDRLEGIAKLSQNKPAEEIARLSDRLGELSDPGAQAIAKRMRALTPPAAE